VTTRAIELRSQLERYTTRDPRESDHLARMRELCESVARPLDRTTFAPGHITASAFILSPDGRALLLILHGKLGLWLQPGGHVDADDRDVLAAALREVREEVGLVDLSLVTPAPFDLDVHAIPARKTEPAHLHFDVRYLLRASSLEVVAASDAQAVRWVPLDQLDHELTDQSVLRAVAKLRTTR
jgi:8-oxo-dGTP pyrophosphatase MutT (NUDIX family)